MAKRVNFWELPIEAAQPDDTLVAYRGRGKVTRVKVDDVQGSGTVTSVGVSMPTGFSVANSPITSSGTITVTFDSGYGLPTTAAMGEWSTAYGWGDHAQAGYALASAVTSALAGKVDKVAGKGLSTEDYSTAEKSKLSSIETGAQVNTVTSVAGKTGAVTLAKGDVGLGSVDNTSDADKPISTAVSVALSGKVDTSDARLTNSREWTASTVSQAEAEAGTATTRRAWTAQRVFQAIAAWWAASAAKSKLDGIQAGATANATDAQLRDRATHTGTQPASTITGLATVATSGSYNDLTNKPSIPAGTVTSVGLSAPTGFSVSGSPVTGSGTLALTFASGYSLPTTAKQGQWDQAYGWGNHASAGYALSSSLATVATSGSYGDLSGKPTLGTAASKDAPSSGNATSTQVVLGNDTRLTDARTPTSHTHTAAQVTGLSTVATTGSYNDLSNKPAIPAGTVTSVNVSVPTGLQASGGPVTTSGTLTISYATGYSIPANSKQLQWDTAYGWGDHAAQGYLTAASIASMVTTNTAQTITGQKTVTTDMRFDGASVSYIRPATTGGWARGFWWTTRPDDSSPNTRIGGIGVLGSNQTVTKFYIGFGVSPWSGSTAEFFSTYSNFKTSLRVDGVEVATQAYTYSKTEVDALISAATSGAWVWQATTTTLPKNTPSKVDFSSPRTLTLPASPAENDYVAILRTAGTTVGSTIARNGQTIMGVAENMTLDVNVSYLRLDFVNSSWRISS